MPSALPGRRDTLHASPGVLALGAAACLLVAAAPLRANTEDAELIYECGLAMQFAEKEDIQLPVSSNRAMGHFAEVTRNDPNLRNGADRQVRAVWDGMRKSDGRPALERYVLSVAQDCSDLYVELAERDAAAVEGELNSLGTLSAAALRSYATRTGDLGEIANYLVYN